MHEYDTILKRLMMRFSPAAAAQLTGFEVRRWLNVELPELRNLRVDLLGETPGGELFHIELQSRNDPDMARRMLEYALAIYGQYRRRPEQLVLYTGEAPMRMSGGFVEFGFECRVADIREFDPEPLLASPSLADNVVTVLMRHRDQRAALAKLLGKIAGAGPEERAVAMAEVFVLAGLRRIAPLVRKEAEKMPILDDIMDHELLGPMIRKARAEARQEEGRQIVLRLIEKRFGSLPAWAQTRLEGLHIDEIESAALRLLDDGTLEELLSR
jgi:Domain of unknown function (DUF4351)